jgi:EAL domain-containing protein (putative c-di-GMP-specific phosphodiesterase class I)
MPSRAPSSLLSHAGAGGADARREAALEAAQAALQDAEARFRRLVEQVPTVTYICDYDEAPRPYGLGPGTLVIEITESALSEPADVAPVLDRIAELGVKIAIDDFGAGFSSLTRLRHLTVHILKLDRSFLAGVPGDARGAALIGAMLQLARELGLYVVAEGIETPEQLDHLRRAGASHGQGFHLARPMPATELTQLLQSCSGLGGAPS